MNAKHTEIGSESDTDSGVILVFVLVLLTLVSLGSVVVVGAAFVNAKTTSVTQAVNNGFYAADGGMEYAIADLRAGNPLCAAKVPTTVPHSLDGPGGRAIAVRAHCVLTTALLTANITSTAGGGVNEKHVTAHAVVAINLVSPSRNVSVESWSSVQS